jgi:hypothetical protein
MSSTIEFLNLIAAKLRFFRQGRFFVSRAEKVSSDGSQYINDHLEVFRVATQKSLTTGGLP